MYYFKTNLPPILGGNNGFDQLCLFDLFIDIVQFYYPFATSIVLVLAIHLLPLELGTNQRGNVEFFWTSLSFLFGCVLVLKLNT